MGGSGATLGAAKALAHIQPEGVKVGRGGAALDGLLMHSTRPGDCAAWLSADGQLFKLHRLKLYCSRPSNLHTRQVHFIIASCENMVDAKGCRPGDILVASNGKVWRRRKRGRVGCWAGQAAASARRFPTMAVSHPRSSVLYVCCPTYLQTVEINNTDAEGRLTLADALLFAQNQCGAGGCSGGGSAAGMQAMQA